MPRADRCHGRRDFAHVALDHSHAGVAVGCEGAQVRENHLVVVDVRDARLGDERLRAAVRVSARWACRSPSR